MQHVHVLAASRRPNHLPPGRSTSHAPDVSLAALCARLRGDLLLDARHHGGALRCPLAPPGAAGAQGPHGASILPPTGPSHAAPRELFCLLSAPCTLRRRPGLRGLPRSVASSCAAPSTSRKSSCRVGDEGRPSRRRPSRPPPPPLNFPASLLGLVKYSTVYSISFPVSMCEVQKADPLSDFCNPSALRAG